METMTYASDTGNYWLGTSEGILILPHELLLHTCMHDLYA